MVPHKGRRDYTYQTSVVVKILESIIKDNVMEHLTSNGLLKSSQHGFLPGRSCLTNLLEFEHSLSSYLNDGHPCDVVYIDCAKAFDVIPHKRLIAKLEAHGISGNVLKWIEAWLSGRRQRVVLNGKSSDWTNVTSSIVQGSCLGPTLFLIYINDLDEGIRSSLLKFADDTKVYRPILSEKDHDILQSDLNRLQKWSDTWCLRFNPSKCTILRYGASGTEPYYINGIQIKSGNEEKDLGVTFEVNGKVGMQCRLAAKAATFTLGQIKRNFNTRSPSLMLKLYKQYCRPKLDYCTQVWNPCYKKDINVLEAVQKRFVSLIKGLKSDTYEDKLGELGLTTLERRRHRGDCLEVYKILNNIEGLDCSKYFNFVEESNPFHTRSVSKKLLKIKRHSNNFGRHSFQTRAALSWNSLPLEIRDSPSVNSFKARYDSYHT